MRIQLHQPRDVQSQPVQHFKKENYDAAWAMLEREAKLPSARWKMGKPQVAVVTPTESSPAIQASYLQPKQVQTSLTERARIQEFGDLAFPKFCKPDSKLKSLQTRYVRQLQSPPPSATPATSISQEAKRKELRKARQAHLKTINRLIDRLEKIPHEQQTPAVEACISRLVIEAGQMKALTETVLKLCKQNARSIPSHACLRDLLDLTHLSTDQVDGWLSNGFDLVAAAKSHRSGLSFSDAAALAGCGNGAEPDAAQRDTIEHLLDARSLLKTMPAPDFQQLAKELILRKVPTQALEVMLAYGIDPSVATLPTEVLDFKEASDRVGLLGKGGLSSVYKVTVGSGQGVVFKEEGNDVPGQGENAGIPAARQGANLTGRTVASSAVAQYLKISSAPKSRPVALRMPGSTELMYGEVSDLVIGEKLRSDEGVAAKIQLDPQQFGQLKGLTAADLQNLADRFGFLGASLEQTPNGDVLVLNVQQPEAGTEFKAQVAGGMYAIPIDIDQRSIRKSASDMGFWSAITGQVDLNMGNIMARSLPHEDGPTLVSFDNNISGGADHFHPNSQITLNYDGTHANYKEWQSLLDQIVERARSSESGPAPERPSQIGAEQRAAILAMTQDRFDSRYASQLDTSWRRNSAWRDMQVLQKDLKTLGPDGKPLIPDLAEEWRPLVAGNVFAYGVPPVISRQLKTDILALNEKTVREKFCSALGQPEQKAYWERVMAVQDLLSIEGRVTVVDNPADWTSPDITRKLGLDPHNLEAVAREMSKGDAFMEVIHRESLLYGFPRIMALMQTHSRLWAEGAFDPSSGGSQGQRANPAAMRENGVPAYFERAAILKLALDKAHAALQRESRTSAPPAPLQRTKVLKRTQAAFGNRQHTRIQRTLDPVS